MFEQNRINTTKYENKGFTLVEMVITITVIAIVVAAAAWGVTGGVAHYAYVGSEEKAKTIYLAAQSALSNRESRGALDAYMVSLRKTMGGDGDGTGSNIFKQASQPAEGASEEEKAEFEEKYKGENPDLLKAAYHIPSYKDNEGNEHEYGFLSVNLNRYKDESPKNAREAALFDLIESYVSEKEILNGSILIEFDLTAGKVYSVFYSEWATSIEYRMQPANVSVEREAYYIYYDPGTGDARNPKEREDFAVGYYAADQVNVISFASGTPINITECRLHNEETLYLSMSSDSEREDEDTSFDVALYKKGDDSDVKFCTFTVARMKDGTPLSKGGQRMDTIDVTLTDGSVFNDGKKTKPMDFMVSYEESKDPEEQAKAPEQRRYVLCITLDAVTTGMSMAFGDAIDKDKKTDLTGFSITRIMGLDPSDIYAGVSVVGIGEANYVSGVSMESNVKNALFSEKESADTFKISNIRHLSNIRYSEASVTGAQGFEYDLVEDLDYSNAKIYSRVAGEEGILRLDGIPRLDGMIDTSVVGFPMIDFLSEHSTINGKNDDTDQDHSISNFLINNRGAVEYERQADGTVDKNGDLTNIRSTAGIIGRNNGTIKNIKVKNSKASILPFSAENADKAIYGDKIEAAGILCGRSTGTLKGIVFDKDCDMDADVFRKLDDREEAARDGLDLSDVAVTESLNERYACGVGMLSGTVILKNGEKIDDIKTSGKVVGRLHDVTATPAITQQDARERIYEETKETNISGIAYSNADLYAYGVGGIFGYAYGTGISNDFGIGISGVKESVVNKANVTGDSFTGGIAGNLFISGLSEVAYNEKDEDNDLRIPATAMPQLVNCHNYGDTKGVDFVGGIVGINGRNVYIRDCNSYGSPSATGGVSAGIASENYGFIYNCGIDRTRLDGDDYIPKISGNMVVAGAIASVNHRDSVIADCHTAVVDIDGLNDKILISGDDMDTFGYLVGKNDGIVNGGKAGRFIGYDSRKTKMIIGGAVGSNYSVTKNITVTAELEDDGEAEVIGGVAGENLGRVTKCIFAGKITKDKGISVDITVGGITGRNVGTYNASIKDCYLVGAQLEVTGKCTYTETDGENNRLRKSSAVGGVCAVNEFGAKVENCYLTGLGKADADKNADTDTDGNTIVDRQTELDVRYGMVGGVAAVNYGSVKNCGYTDKIFYQDGEELKLTEDTKDLTADMDLAEKAIGELKTIRNTNADNYTASETAIKSLSDLFMNDDTGFITPAANKVCGYLTDDKEKYQYALPKESLTDGGMTWSAYNADSDFVVLSMSNGRGCIGGIVGYNTQSGKVEECASGRWLVENYLPAVKYNATGGVIGLNAASGDKVNTNINFAYVRTELPAIPYSDLNEYGQDIYGYDKAGAKENNRFYYVGGVIGEQKCANTGGWTLSSCVNVGTVVNYYGNNVGGVTCKIAGNGGTVEYCYNYGLLMSGYTTKYMQGFSGTAGGIVAHYSDLQGGQTNNVLHCRNYGTVGFPMQGVDAETNIRKSRFGGMIANDVGGVVGEISAPNSTKLYTVNIEDCVNAKSAKVYGQSQTGGIISMIGCLMNEQMGGGDSNTVNSIFVNIDTCRNYSSEIWDTREVDTDGEKMSHGGAGILSQRRVYGGDEELWIGHTTIQNCFSILMTGYKSDGNQLFDNNNGGGAIAKSKKANQNDFEKSLKYSGNNYFMDECSFQYYSSSKLREDGSTSGNAQVLNNVAGNICVNVGESAPAGNNTLSYGSNNKITNSYRCSDKKAGTQRMAVVSYGSNGRYALIVEPDGYKMANMTVQNTWKDGNYICFKGKDSGGVVSTVKCPIIYTFSEGANSAPYSIELVDYFKFDRLRKDDSYRSQLEGTYNSLSGKKLATRLPVADEYDMDEYAFDAAFLKYIKTCKDAQDPDIVENLSVKDNKKEGNYLATWGIRPSSGSGNATAKEFDVEIRYVKVEEGTDFDPTKIDEYIAEYGKPHDTDELLSYGTSIGFVTPDDMTFETGYDYYAVVRARDSRAKTKANPDSWYSDVLKNATYNNKTISSYIKIEKKLPTPEFEIIAYRKKWMLHLKNADKFTKYINLNNFEVGVYGIKAKTNDTIDDNTIVKLTKSDICVSDNGLKPDALLNNAVDATKLATRFTNEADRPGQVLYGYAKADGCLDADLYKFTVYIPQSAAPDVDFEIEVSENGLNKKKPYYTGTLKYNAYDRNSTIVPSVSQVFRVELYGTRKETDEDGKETIWHETIAYKEYSLNVGETTDINIGYYDAPSTVTFNGTYYTSFNIDVWYASPGQGDVYTYFETTAERADKTKRNTGYVKDVSNKEMPYFFKPVKLPTPVFEIVPYDGSWQLHLKNAEEYESFIDKDGFEVGAYAKVNGNPSDTQRVSLTKTDISKLMGGTQDDGILNDYNDALSIAKGTKDYVLYGYAKATDYNDSSLSAFTVYVPQKVDAANYLVNPIIIYNLNDTDNRLWDKTQPSYTGTLTYPKFDNKNGKIPPVPQIFLVELYGTRSGKDSENSDITWHETIAKKEYSLAQGGSQDVNIGYSDVREGIDLSVYDSFHVDVRYYSPGQGPVYNYIETTEAKAAKKLRGTGFVTDVTGENIKYYYYPFLKTPKIRIVGADRNPSYYAVLENVDDFVGSGAQISVKEDKKNRTTIIDTSTPIDVNGVDLYATQISQSGWDKSWAKVIINVTADGRFLPAETQYSSTKNTLCLQRFTDNNGMNISFTSEVMFTESDGRVTGVSGTIKSTSHKDITQYFRYEVFGKDSNGDYKTVYLSDDKAMTIGQEEHTYDVNEDLSGIDLSGYSDLKFAVWYSKCDINSNATDKSNGNCIYQYVELTEDVAKKMSCYNKNTGRFEGSRESGLLIYNSSSGTKYYYVSALYDNANYRCVSNTYGTYFSSSGSFYLYAESP
ncbi:MAG: prepilin-type N-terminal cleavage/methylation domain-containing protein [Lachnospiraceae bacterium]|nr:prepilin-type N-terminal cleavage/methylation domain-containing protein [Lachnospiraceae bacterium]